jgi:hypothetical protein
VGVTAQSSHDAVSELAWMRVGEVVRSSVCGMARRGRRRCEVDPWSMHVCSMQ